MAAPLVNNLFGGMSETFVELTAGACRAEALGRRRGRPSTGSGQAARIGRGGERLGLNNKQAETRPAMATGHGKNGLCVIRSPSVSAYSNHRTTKHSRTTPDLAPQMPSGFSLCPGSRRLGTGHKWSGNGHGVAIRLALSACLPLLPRREERGEVGPWKEILQYDHARRANHECTFNDRRRRQTATAWSTRTR